MSEMASIEHGTPRGHGQHIRTGTLACQPCLDAHRLDMRLSRMRRGKVHSLNIPLDVLADILAGDGGALARYLGPDLVKAFADRSRTGRAA
jgi:hypothetical protein